MKKSFAKRLAILLVVVMVALTASTISVALLAKREPKRGIVIVTALISGGLYLNNPDGTQTQLWDPILNYEDFPVQETILPDGSYNISMDLISAVMERMGGIEPLLALIDPNTGILPSLMVDKMTGKSVLDISPATPDSPNRIKYGALGSYKQTVDSMTAEYGDIAEAVVFNYDWRLDNRDNAKLLEKFINERGYDEIVLTSHSMGGNVCSTYLAMSEENREKVVLYCPYAPSILGAIDAVYYMEDARNLLNMFNLGSVESIVAPIVDSMANPFLRGMVSIYQLFPHPVLLESGQYTNEDGDYMITVDGEPIRTREELIDFYKSRPYAKNEEGEWIYIFQTEENGKTRLENFFDSSFVEVNGKTVHATSLVNTVFFAGNGIRSLHGLDFVTDETGAVVLDKARYSRMGDNMVILYSATAGLGPDAQNVQIVDKGAHASVGVNFDVLLMERTFEEINKVWRTEE